MGSANSWERFTDKRASLVSRLGGTSNILLGYRPEGHDVSPDGFGSFRPHALRFGRVRQFTMNIGGSNRLQLHIGGSDANEEPTTPIQFVDVWFPGREEVGGSPLFTTLTWTPSETRWQSEGEGEIRTWMEANAGVPIKVAFRPRES